MTLEELQARIEELEAENQRVVAKNSELLGKNKKAKEDAETARTLAEEAAEERDRKAGDIAALEKRLTEKFEQTINTLTGERDAAIKQHQTSQVKAAIQSAFAQHNVLNDAREMVEGFFTSRVSFEDGEAKIDGEALGDHLTNYFKSDKAKPFISASVNSGVGPKQSSPSTSSAQQASGFTKENFLARSGEWGAMASSTDPALRAQARIIATQVGRPELTKNITD